MAGPSVTVRILGDLKGLGQSLGEAGDKAAGVAQKGSAAFRGWLGGINATGALGPIGPMLDGIGTAIDGMVNKAKGIGPALMGGGAALAGLGAGLSAFGSKEQASQQQLKQAIESTGGSYEDFGKQIDDAVKHGENFGKTSAETQDALRILTQATHDPAKALELLGTGFDLSAAKHEDLTTAATQLGRTFNGNTKLLKEFGVTAGPAAVKATKELESAQKGADTAAQAVAKAHQHLADVQESLKGKTHLTVEEQHRLRDAQAGVITAEAKAQDANGKLQGAQENLNQATQGVGTNVQNLSDVLKGQASAATDTFGGKLKALQAKAEDAISQFGQKFGPAMQAAGIAMMTFGAMMDAGLGPLLLVIAAVAAVIAIGYLLYRNWGTIWGGIKAVVGAAVDWIKDHWQQLLIVFTGFFGVLVVLFVNNFDKIKAVVLAVVNFIVSVVEAIIGAVRAVVEVVVAVFSAVFDAVHTMLDSWVGRIEAVISNVLQWISNVWTLLIDILSVPFNIARDIISAAIGAISAAIGWVIGFIQAVWATLTDILSTPFRIAHDFIAFEIQGIQIIVGAIAGFVSAAVSTVASILSVPFNIAKDLISTAIDTIKHLVSSIGDWISTAMAGMENVIAAPFRIAWNIISDIVEKIKGAISSVTDKLGAIGGFFSDVGGGAVGLGKKIAGLQSGGIVTRPTLAVIGEAGPEAVVPLNHMTAVQQSGPSVVIENANFAQELDVDLFMRRAAWVAQTSRM